MGKYRVYSTESMIQLIREEGIIPLFKGAEPGRSIEEMTDPDCWFTTSDQLGPWDWKINAVQEGDIVYGKFYEGKAAFATTECFGHLMNYRRSLPKYRMALGEKYPAKTRSEILMKHLAPYALDYIRRNGSAESREIRIELAKAVTPALIRKLGSAYKANLQPVVKKSICDTVIQFLEMGTWIVAGEIRRVYRGPAMEYKGWQRTSLAMPEDLFGSNGTSDDMPSWARHIEDSAPKGLLPDCTPEASLEFLTEYGIRP